MARISRAFPGLFTSSELLELDYRDFDFWLWEAQRAEIIERQEMIAISRMAMATDESYSREIQRLSWQLRLHDKEDEIGEK